MKLLFCFSLLVLLAGCEPLKPFPTSIRFVAGPCYGPCPYFSMIIDQDGTAEFLALENNHIEGNYTTMIHKAQLDSLTQLLREADLLNLEEFYSTDVSNLPTYKLQASFSNGQRKHIYDKGPKGPLKLKKVYRFIFSLRQSQDWKPVAAK